MLLFFVPGFVDMQVIELFCSGNLLDDLAESTRELSNPVSWFVERFTFKIRLGQPPDFSDGIEPIFLAEFGWSVPVKKPNDTDP